MKKSKLKQIIKEEILNELHSGSNVRNSKEFKDALTRLISIFETRTYGDSYKKEIANTLMEFGESMLDLGEKLTYDEMKFLQSLKQPSMAAESK